MPNLRQRALARRNVLLRIGGAFVLAIVAPGALSAASPSIGWLKIQGPDHSPDQLKTFREGMAALDQIEGRNYVLVERYAEDKEKTFLPSANFVLDGR